MDDQTKNEDPSQAPAEKSDEASTVDLDVEDWLQDTVTLLCGQSLEKADETAKVNHVRGVRMVKYMIHLFDPRRDTGAVKGRRGHTILALQDIVKSMGGAHNRIYQLELEDDGWRPNDDKETTPPGTTGTTGSPAPGSVA